MRQRFTTKTLLLAACVCGAGIGLDASAQEVIQGSAFSGTTVQDVAGSRADYARQPARASEDRFKGYDFGEVVETLETSIDPLQRELDASFKVFAESLSKAESLLEEGKTREAVEQAAAAIDGVLAVRDTVLDPMWDGQTYLGEQVAAVRTRLAKALSAGTGDAEVQLDKQTEATLDRVAKRISSETDPLRKRRLVAHYRSVRNLAQIRALAQRMSPDERKLWSNVLQVLDQAALAHQQVLMGSEVLFAQFEATSSNLHEYLELIDTVDGAAKLLGVVQGVDASAGGMAQFAQSMEQLQGRLGGFNDALQGVLESSMFELEAEVDAIQQQSDEGLAGVASTESDAELTERLRRLEGGS